MSRILALLLAGFLALPCEAAIFSDNFDSYALGAPTGPSFGPWTVTNGTVDVIGDPGFYDLLPGNGRYLDLDGSTNSEGAITTTVIVTPGLYDISFDLAGSQRGTFELVQVTVSDGVTPLILLFGRASGDQFSTEHISYLSATNSLTVEIANYSYLGLAGDNVGALLDNVAINAAVPEPAALTVWALGLAACGYGARRKLIAA